MGDCAAAGEINNGSMSHKKGKRGVRSMEVNVVYLWQIC